MPDVGGDPVPPEYELRATIRMIARQDESAAAGLGDGNGQIRAFDGFEPAEEYERSVGCNAPDKCIPVRIDKVGNGRPESTGCAAQPADVFAATGKAQRTTAEAGGERNLRATGVTLIRHHLGQACEQQRRQVGQAREAMQHVGPKDAHRAA